VNLKTPITIEEALGEAFSRIKSISETPNLDAQILLGHSMGVSRTWVIGHAHDVITPNVFKNFQSLISQREIGVPLPYILGWWEFYGRRFRVSEEVLIPRPETELLVEVAINYLTQNSARQFVLDIGTGSGCIAISLAAEISRLEILATDISRNALGLAKENAVKHGVSERIHFVQMDLSTGVSAQPDVVCANLPYIPGEQLQNLEVANWEPSIALDGGVNGLSQIIDLLDDLPRIVQPGGMILLEVEEKKGDDVRVEARERFPDGKIELHCDLAGKDRLLSIIV
jgi:release factor glutamine methyltransferase